MRTVVLNEAGSEAFSRAFNEAPDMAFSREAPAVLSFASVRLANLRCQPEGPCVRLEVLEVTPSSSGGGCMVSSFWDA